jgi:hypothetical protein
MGAVGAEVNISEATFANRCQPFLKELPWIYRWTRASTIRRLSRKLDPKTGWANWTDVLS